jgi:hypothetical protein
MSMMPEQIGQTQLNALLQIQTVKSYDYAVWSLYSWINALRCFPPLKLAHLGEVWGGSSATSGRDGQEPISLQKFWLLKRANSFQPLYAAQSESLFVHSEGLSIKALGTNCAGSWVWAGTGFGRRARQPVTVQLRTSHCNEPSSVTIAVKLW